MNLKDNKKILFFSVAFLLVGLLVGFTIKKRDFCNSSKFAFINPDLVCNSNFVVGKQGYTSLKSRLESFIKDKRDNKVIDSVSIYFRDLQNGPTLGIQEHEQFSPASLLKLPMMLTYFQISGSAPELLETRVAFKGLEGKEDQFFSPKESIQENTTYTIEYLIDTMIKYSDNRSYYALREYLHELFPNTDMLQRTFLDLGIIDPKYFSDQTVSVKSYASIFLQLYNNTFFSNKELSNKALELLSQTDFKKGLVAGVPEQVKTSHKFGERSNLPNGLKQLHDCGIIYYPKNPYILCVMTRGYDFDSLSDTISELSKMFYEEFDSRKL